ncbi:glycosyltransferase [Umboniibacter marinipuniceus]|uniref:Glycosyl transferase-like sugar-binding protein n=1 Tax=Umboniibacter marinipuniceus TaxID=569599 RepID=A0A3M0A210_9GAMM|nr:glycosyltransferase [Umboniibacter marinipuniceus]RMA78666.1 hypothetical protein DFR27_1996 [Umboniibacter marinipuniceus]
MNIICMKWGDKFPPHYVNRLYAMVRRNLTGDFRFVCFTENGTGIRDEVEVQPLPELDLPSGLPERGWRKLTVFAPGFGGLEGPTLFLDLDVVIVDSIDPFFDIEGEFFIAHDKKNPAKMEGNSSIFRFIPGSYPEILQNFVDNFEQVRGEVRHEQAYLSREMHRAGKMQFWPDEWVPSFKYKCLPRFPMNFFVDPFIPDDAKILIFHGLPNPPEAVEGKSGKWYRHFKPARWIEDYWCE